MFLTVQDDVQGYEHLFGDDGHLLFKECIKTIPVTPVAQCLYHNYNGWLCLDYLVRSQLIQYHLYLQSSASSGRMSSVFISGRGVC